MHIAKDCTEDAKLLQALQTIFAHRAVLDVHVSAAGTSVWITNRHGERVVQIDSATIEYERAAVFDEFAPPLSAVELVLIAVARFLDRRSTTK